MDVYRLTVFLEDGECFKQYFHSKREALASGDFSDYNYCVEKCSPRDKDVPEWM